MKVKVLTKPCDCGQDGRPVLVSTIPGSMDGKLVTLWICPECYERDGWAESDLSGNQPVELILRLGEQ